MKKSYIYNIIQLYTYIYIYIYNMHVRYTCRAPSKLMPGMLLLPRDTFSRLKVTWPNFTLKPKLFLDVAKKVEVLKKTHETPEGS